MDILAASWTRWLEPPTLWGIITFLVAIIAIVAPQWRRAHQTSEISRLIKRMVEQGYSADEIERILRAGLPAHADRRADRRTFLLRSQNNTSSGAED